MTIKVKETESLVTTITNAATTSIQSVVPMSFEVKEAIQYGSVLDLNYGVIVGLTGDLKGSIVLASEPSFFQHAAEIMYGFPLEGEMLTSFTGELGNMIIGGLTTSLVSNGLSVNITPPTVLEGETKLTANKETTEIPFQFENHQLQIYLMLKI